MFRYLCDVVASMGPSAIDLYEWKREDVLSARLSNNPLWSHFATPVGTLPLSGIRLAHAVIKTDYLIARNHALPSLGFLLQMDQIIDFGSSANLRLMPGASSVLADVTQSSLAGRVGQGFSLLFAEARNYSFLGHLSSDSSVLAHLALTGSKRVADFLFEHNDCSRMILESKASFTLKDDACSPIKRMLKKALSEQVLPWMSVVTPTPSKGYAVFSCLREAGNKTNSAIIFVDPPGKESDGPRIKFPEDWVRRQNYGGWLRAMGLPEAANRLLAGSDREITGKPEPVPMSIVAINGRRYCVLTSVERPNHLKGMRFAIGIEMDAIQALSSTIAGAQGALLEYQPQQSEEWERSESLSILSDGTLFGLVPRKSFLKHEIFHL